MKSKSHPENGMTKSYCGDATIWSITYDHQLHS